MNAEKSNILKPETWVDQYSDYLFNYAIISVNNKETALDLVQETFVAGLSSINSFEGRSSEKTWLVSILKRKIIDYYRKASNRREEKLLDKNFMEGKVDLPFQTEGDHAGHWRADRMPQDWKISTDSAIENEELARILEDCIAHLPAKWAAIFIMRVVEEYESEKVCKEMEVSSSNLWVIIHRARIKLRECIEKNWIIN